MTYAANTSKSYNGAVHVVSTPGIASKGVAITTGGTSVSAAIPNTSSGASPDFVRLAATAACYARLGASTEASAVVSTAGTGYVTGEVITLTGGTASEYMILSPATLKLLSCSVLAAGTGYALTDTITLSGGTFSQAAIATVATTKVVSATVDVGGTGDLADGAGVIVIGTTGTGTLFRASVTIASNAIVSVQSITVAGSYTVGLTDILHEPVAYVSGAASGTLLVGAQLSVAMGVGTVTVTTPGVYTETATSFTQTSTTGSGTGFTANTSSYGLLTVAVVDAGSYTVQPSNPVAQGSTTGSGASGEFTVTWATAAAAGDMLIQPGDAVVVGARGFDFVAAIQVTGAGILQCSPIEV